MKSEKLSGLYEGLKLAVKLIKFSKDTEEAIFRINQHIAKLNEVNH